MEVGGGGGDLRSGEVRGKDGKGGGVSIKIKGSF